MFSWFPILFPLREPIQLKKDDIITLHFWRLVSKAERPLFFLL
jgi:protein arginine N-methyltransferase 5